MYSQCSQRGPTYIPMCQSECKLLVDNATSVSRARSVRSQQSHKSKSSSKRGKGEPSLASLEKLVPITPPTLPNPTVLRGPSIFGEARSVFSRSGSVKAKSVSSRHPSKLPSIAPVRSIAYAPNPFSSSKGLGKTSSVHSVNRSGSPIIIEIQDNKGNKSRQVIPQSGRRNVIDIGTEAFKSRIWI